MSGEFPSSLRAGSPVDRRTSQRDSGAARQSWIQQTPASAYPPSINLSAVPSAYEPPAAYDSNTHSTRESPTRKSLTSSSKPAYTIPQPPEPPRLTIPTISSPYQRTPTDDPSDPWAIQHAQPSHKTSRQRSLLSRGFGTIKSLASPLSARSRYGKLEDHLDDDKRHIRDEDDEQYDLGGVDISAFEGPYALQSMAGSKPIPNVAIEERRESDSSSADAGADGISRMSRSMRRQRTDSTILGGGMKGVLEAGPRDDDHLKTPLTPAVERSRSTLGRMRTVIQRSKSARSGVVSEEAERERAAHMEAQRAADEKGEILAMTEEVPAVDISGLSGSSIGNRNTFDSLVSGQKTQMQKSYFFPEDPEQPDWRPFSMHWAYISFLTVSALFLAGFQEFLCQYSIRQREKGSGVLQFTRPQDVSTIDYFAWKYLPTMLLVTYGVFWQITDYEVKRLEPYYQLSQRTGASAAESINMDYLTFMSYFIPFKAVRYRHWAVLVSSTAYLLASSLVPILQSASVNMIPDINHREVDKPKYVIIDPGWSRGLTVALLLNAICGVILLFQLRRKSGLLSDPKGIAGIAAMATRSHILEDFRGLDTASHRAIHKQLRHRRYILHKSSLWQGEYINEVDRRDSWEAENAKRHKKPENPHPPMLTLAAGIPYIIALTLFAVLIPVFVFTPAMVVTEKLPWLLTTLATFIKLAWGTLDGDVRLMEPFYLLSKHRAPASTLTLDYTGTIPGWLSIKAAINGHYLVSAVGFCAIATEVLTVCVSSFGVDGSKFFPGANDTRGDNRYNSDETFKSFWVSFALAVGILAVLVGTAIVVYARRRHPFLPRQPGTVASVLAFIHQSKCLADFVGTERYDSRAMTAALEGLGKTYALGWFYGRDGDYHCGIDEDPVQEYRHGHDPERGRLLPKHIGTFDHY